MRFFLAALLWLGVIAGADAQMMQSIVNAKSSGSAPALTISCASTGSTSSTIACTLTYAGTAPSSATGAWNTTCTGSSTITSFTASAGTGSFTASTPSSACAGTLTITTNIPTTATSGTVTIGGGSYVGPGDIVSGALFDLSTRAYNLAYATGSNNAATLRRASDSTTSNIVIKTNGNYDEATVATFCSATSCYNQEWFDQTGNGKNGNQATTTDQPLNVMNKSPFTGFNTSFQMNAATGTATPAGRGWWDIGTDPFNPNADLTLIAWVWLDLSGGSQTLMGGAVSNGGVELFVAANGQICVNKQNITAGGCSATGAVPTGTWTQIAVTFTHGTLTGQFYANGVASGSTWTVPTFTTSLDYSLGTSVDNFLVTGFLAEFLAYQSVLTPTQISNIFSGTSP